MTATSGDLAKTLARLTRSVRDQIPVFVITGHLGSGKTSVINHLLAQTSGLKIGVVVNDFGEINLDAMMVARQSDELVELSNGCLCCTLANELDDSLNRLATDASALDLILVEASGVADPTQMMRLIYNSQNPHITLRDLIYVVDLLNLDQALNDNPQLVRLSLDIAGLVILNKQDLATKEQLSQAQTLLAELATRATSVVTTHGQIPIQLLVDLAEADFVQLKLGQQAIQTAADFNQTSVEFSQPLDPLTTTRLLNQLPKEIYRLKGLFFFGAKAENRHLLIQVVGGQHSIGVLDAESSVNLGKKSYIVAIGHKFDVADFKRRLQNCIDSAPDQVTSENLVTLDQFKVIK